MKLKQSSYKRIHRLAEANRWLKSRINAKLILCTRINDDTLYPYYGIIDTINKSNYVFFN